MSTLQTELLYSRWDSLVILDACRFDAFEKVNRIKGRLREADSQAFNTSKWFESHWKGPFARNTVLITAQPMPFWTEAHKEFRAAVRVDPETEDWIHPRYTINEALKADDCDERLLIHLVPPHLPYQGEKGKAFNTRIGADKILKGLWDEKFGPNTIQHVVEKYGRENGWDELKEYYIENIELALEEVMYYIQKTARDRIVISADHGDLLGEHDVYGHSLHDPLLMRVPWLEVRQ